jgi:hypothetical protein
MRAGMSDMGRQLSASQRVQEAPRPSSGRRDTIWALAGLLWGGENGTTHICARLGEADGALDLVQVNHDHHHFPQPARPPKHRAREVTGQKERPPEGGPSPRRFSGLSEPGCWTAPKARPAKASKAEKHHRPCRGFGNAGVYGDRHHRAREISGGLEGDVGYECRRAIWVESKAGIDIAAAQTSNAARWPTSEKQRGIAQSLVERG